MPRFVAFLRAINVGGRNIVKMDSLRRMFQEMELENVATFIQSGNVIFDARRANPDALERRIEGHLRKSLGYPVGTFLRSLPDLVALCDHCAFADQEIDAGAVLYVGFLRVEPDAARRRQLTALNNDVDVFRVRGREWLWLRRKYRGKSVKDSAIGRALDAETTVRNITTIRKIAAKYQT